MERLNGCVPSTTPQAHGRGGPLPSREMGIQVGILDRILGMPLYPLGEEAWKMSDED